MLRMVLLGMLRMLRILRVLSLVMLVMLVWVMKILMTRRRVPCRRGLGVLLLLTGNRHRRKRHVGVGTRRVWAAAGTRAIARIKGLRKGPRRGVGGLYAPRAAHMRWEIGRWAAATAPCSCHVRRAHTLGQQALRNGQDRWLAGRPAHA